MAIARLPGGWTSSSSRLPSAVPSSSRPPASASSPSGTVSEATRGAAHAEAVVRVGHPGADVRVQRPHGALQLGGGAGGVQAALIAIDLLRVGHAFLPLGLGIGDFVQRPDQQPAAQIGQPGGQRCRSRRRAGSSSVALRYTGPGVQLGDRAHDAHAGLAVAGLDGPLHRRRAAPARQQRGVHVVRLVGRQQRLADDGAVGAHQQRVGAGRGDGLDRLGRVHVVGLVDLDAQLARAVGHRRRLGAPAAPARAVGAGHHQRRAVVRAGHAIQHRRGEIRGSQVDGAHFRHPRGEPPPPALRTPSSMPDRLPPHSRTRPTAAGWPTAAASAARCSRPAGCWARPWCFCPGARPRPRWWPSAWWRIAVGVLLVARPTAAAAVDQPGADRHWSRS